MLKTINDFYKMELEHRKGDCMKLSELELDFTFALIEDAKTFVVHQLVNQKKAKLYYGVHMNSNNVSALVEKVGEVKLFNEVKDKGAMFNTSDFVQQYAKDQGLGKNDDLVADDEFHEKMNEAMNEAVAKHKEAAEAATTTSTIKVYKDEFMLLPYDIEIGEYQRILDTASTEGFTIYGEYAFIEIL